MQGERSVGQIKTLPDFSFNIPGRGAIAGSWRGKEGLYELARVAMQVTAGSSGKRLKTCWPMIATPTCSRGTNSCETVNQRSTGPRTSTTFTIADWPSAGNSRKICQHSMTRGASFMHALRSRRGRCSVSQGKCREDRDTPETKACRRPKSQSLK